MQKLMKLMAFFCGVFITVSMCVIIYMGHNRVVVIAQSGPDKNQNYAPKKVTGKLITMKEAYAGGAAFKVPLPAGTTAEKITIENIYNDQKLVITLQGVTGSNYESEYIEGYISAIESAMFWEETEKITIHIQLTEVYEYESFLENDYLKVNLYKPSDKYDRIVVLDEVGKEGLPPSVQTLLHDITELVQVKLEENGVRVYHLEDQGEILGDAKKLELIEQLEANMYLGMGLYMSADNPGDFGTVTMCDTSYFRPYISNVTLADILQKEIVTAVQGKAGGVIESEENPVLENLKIPATVVYPGHASNKQEYSYMEQPSYQEKIATAVWNGVSKAYEMIEAQ